MTGPALAKKLRDLGFSHVKSHMSALDDSELLTIQGTLEAHGLVRDTGVASADSSAGGLVLRKKKKRKKAPEKEAPAEVAATEPSQVAAPEVPAEEPAEASAVPLEAAAETIAADAPETAESSAQVEGPTQDADVIPSPAAAPASADGEAATGEGAVAEEVTTPPEAEAPAAETDDTGKAKTEEGTENTGPNSPAGKVVGFVDLSKIAANQPKRPHTRRLKSRDEAIPDVQPSFAHDPRNMLGRGGGASRGGLTAAQLRQRESGRFLRRNRPGGPGRRGGRGDGRESAAPLIDPGTSPFKDGTVLVEMPVTVKKLAEALSVKSNKMLHTAFKQLGFGAVNINSLLDEDTAVLLAHEFNVELDLREDIAAEQSLITELEEKRASVEDEELTSRAPTVAFLGHVDHGKTTLIDCIRESQVADGEAGGITQHIGAYRVVTEHNHPLTVVDTPGHAAFTAMRARGAQAVDIVVLVVAGDDGVQPHTEEALNHAKAAGTPVVVAVTKMDKPEANSQRVKEQLAGLDLIPEDWGGSTAIMEVSGLKGTGIEELLERVYLESDVLELNCHPAGAASGVVLEAEIQQGKGIVAHLLVQDGCLKRGDVILAGEGYGKVRSIHDDHGVIIEEAGPATPVEVSGLSSLPGVGAAFHVVDDLARAKEVAEERERQNRATSLAGRRTVTAASLMDAVASSDLTTINLIVRADVQGSVEVLRHAIEELVHDEVQVRVLHAGVGAITESDVLLGSTSDALLVAFNVGVNDKARAAAEREDLDIRHYSVIYEILDDLRAMMEGSLAPEISEETTGHVEIRRLFKSSKLGLIAGCMVQDGTVRRSDRCRILRDGTVVHTGAIGSLRREADDAKEVREGFECGIVLKNYRDIKEGDIIETFKTVETKRTLG